MGDRGGAGELLRRARTAQLRNVWNRIERLAKQAQNAQAHISLELQLRNP